MVSLTLSRLKKMQSNTTFLKDTCKPFSVVPNGGELNGMRLAVKDLFHIADMPTTAGNPDWERTHELPLKTNSTVVKLLSSGATYVGKTITDELAYSLNGQNIHYGTPLNVRTPGRLPGGSSSGSAAAVANESADIGLGTDTGGSIRVPASYNGLFGLRPTHGLIPADNMVPLAPSFDTVGWMTRSMSELSRVASVLLPDQGEYGAQPSFGVVQSLLQTAAHKTQIEAWMTDVGLDSQIIDNFDPYAMKLAEAFRVLQGNEIWGEHGEWFLQHNPAMAEDIKSRFEQCRLITQAQVERAKVIQQELKTRLNRMFQKFDVLILPTTPGIGPLLNTPVSELAEYRHKLLSMTAIAGLAGLPQLHLPLFEYEGAACGLSFLGQSGSDLGLIKLATQFVENLTN